ncbi:hypothetical protein Leryth_010601 [Lithospermum erythrorhizon]|nr:hypothetical protein Leryth_010601 [Lithospermum erythrorhizon]
MGAIAPVAKWGPADDLLLKNAVEAGATLESLSKGAVRFSQRYTVQELQYRWHSLLYDPIVSFESSALMFEYECSSLKTQGKSSKSDGTKDTKSLLRKRKAECIRKRYYAMRKMRFNVSQAVDPLEMNFIAGPGLINYGNQNYPSFADYVLPDSCHHRCPDSTFEVTTQACPDGASAAPIFVSHGLCLDPGDLGHNTLLPSEGNTLSTRDHCMTENYGQLNDLPVPDLLKSEGLEVKQPTILNRVTDSEVPVTDNKTSFPNLGYPSALSPTTAWHAMEGISTPILPDVDYGGKEHCINDRFISTHDVDHPDTLQSSFIHPNTNLIEQIPSIGPETETAGIIAQLNQFMDCPDPDDLPDTVGEFYIDTFSTLLADYSNEHEGETAFRSVTSITTEEYPDLASGAVLGESSDNNSSHCSIDPGIFCSKREKEKLLSSALSVNPDFPELRYGVRCCKLNTEDHVIPDNDDVFLPVCMPTPPLFGLADWGFDKARNPISSSIMDIPTHQRASRGGLLMMKNSDNDNTRLSSQRLTSSFPTLQKYGNEVTIKIKREQIDNERAHAFPPAMGLSFQNHDITTRGQGLMPEREQIDRKKDHILSSSIPAPQKTSDQATLVMKTEETDINQTRLSSHIMTSLLPPPVMSSNHAVSVHDDNLKLKHIDLGSDMLRNVNANNQINQLKSTNENENNSRGLYINDKVICMNQTEHQNDRPEGSFIKSQIINHNQIVGSRSVVDASKTKNENAAALRNEVFSLEELDASEQIAPKLEKDSKFLSSGGCPDNDDVPYFSDVEAMILDMDLSPNDEDSDRSETASGDLNEKLIRTMQRLEQAARASSHRMMQLYGAFAVLYGHHSRHLIKKPEVLLGRTSEDIQVDIDLSTERCKNKVSRRQAIIKVNDDGAFSLENLGKASIYVNGREVASRESQYLTSSCLIEIRNAALLFEINPARVKQYMEEEIGRGSKILKQDSETLE